MPRVDTSGSSSVFRRVVKQLRKDFEDRAERILELSVLAAVVSALLPSFLAEG
jgi:hypothetical protein